MEYVDLDETDWKYSMLVLVVLQERVVLQEQYVLQELSYLPLTAGILSHHMGSSRAFNDLHMSNYGGYCSWNEQ